MSDSRLQRIRRHRVHAHRFGDAGVHLCILALLVNLPAVTGCSRSSGTFPVTGTVKQPNGQPLAGGRILFQPTGPATQPAKATIGTDGNFRLGTFNPGDGAVAGVHKVAVYPFVPEDALGNAAAVAHYRSLVPMRYQNIQTTPLEYTVKGDGSANHFDIVLESDDGKKNK